MKFKTILSFSALLFLSCAKQGFPPGGPEDRTPPEIVRTEPAQGQIRVPPGREVIVWFSEGIRPSAVTDAVFFSPNPGEGVKFKWSGKRLKIRFPKPFKDSSTVVITLGTGIQDFQGNALKSSFILAFSTGSILDQGSIRGRVYGSGSALGLDVWAYGLQNGTDPDPKKTEPDYAVQCQETGAFAFSHLSPGKYRLYAVRDRARDRLYQPVEDEIGVPFKDVELSPSTRNADSVSFRITREDTLRPSLVRAVAPNRNLIVLQFDEAVVMPDPWFKTLRIVQSDSTLLRTAYVDPSNPKQICMVTETQKSRKTYSFSIDGLTDLAGNPPDTVVQNIRVESSDKPDTTLPAVTAVQPKNGDRSVPVNGALRLVFSEPMDSVGSRFGIVLSDTTGRAVGCRFQWDTPASVRLFPEIQLESRTHYTLALHDSVNDASGHAVKDTVIHFRTLNTDTLSEISGILSDPSFSSDGAWMVSIKQIENPNLLYHQTLSRPGPYRFDSILPGRYLLECYQDQNGDGQYTYGKVVPFSPSERFAVYPDTIVVRSRWPNEGNNLALP